MFTNCGPDFCSGNQKDFELVKIEKTKAICAQCEKATENKAETGVSVAVISCEGACLRGEISRRIANNICFREMPEDSFRVCLGGAFTKDTNQRKLVRNSKSVIALEGCGIQCASRMMKGVLPHVAIRPILVNRHYKMDNNLFAINDLSDEETGKLADSATKEILNLINNPSEQKQEDNRFSCGC
jgi:uncharacterized metal-binding protein